MQDMQDMTLKTLVKLTNKYVWEKMIVPWHSNECAYLDDLQNFKMETWGKARDMLKSIKTDTPLWKRCKRSIAVPSIIQIVCEKRCLVTADQAVRQSPEPKTAPTLYFDSSDVLRWLGSLLPLWCTLRSCWSYQPVFSGAVLDAWRRTFIDHAPDTPEHDLYSEQAIVEGVKQISWKYDDSLLQDIVHRIQNRGLAPFYQNLHQYGFLCHKGLVGIALCYLFVSSRTKEKFEDLLLYNIFKGPIHRTIYCWSTIRSILPLLTYTTMFSPQCLLFYDSNKHI